MAKTGQHKRHGHHQKRTSNFKKVYHPFMPLLLMLTGSLLVFSALSGPKPNRTPTKTAGSDPPVLAYATNTSAQGLLSATNQRRAAAGVGDLTINSKLNQAAQAKANDMATRNYWSHNTPEGSPPWVFITNAGYSYNKAGENLACGFDESSDVITGWFNSPSHKENLLHSSYQDVGFGIANANNYNCGNIPSTQQTVVVAMYGTPYVAPSSTPTTTTPTTPKASTPTSTKPSSVGTPTQTTQAPATTHTVTLNIVDINGKPAVNIKTTLTSTARTAYTDKNGDVLFANVETGKHVVTLEIDGAKSVTPIDLTGAAKDYKLSIVKPELTGNTTALNEKSPASAVKPQSVSRLQTLTDTHAGWVLGFLILAVVMGTGYIIVKHSIAAHKFVVKGERYILTHLYIDLLVVLLAVALFFLTRGVASIL